MISNRAAGGTAYVTGLTALIGGGTYKNSSDPQTVGGGLAAIVGSASTVSGLVSYWKFDEATGATRVDSYGTNNLTSVNNVAQAVGKIANAAEVVAASSQYLSVASNAGISFGNVDFSIAGWIYPTSVSGVPLLISKFLSADKGQFDIYISGSKLNFGVYNGTSGAATATATTFGNLSANTWYYIACVCDSTNALVKVSVNAGAFDTASKSLVTVKANAAPLLFGQEESSNFASCRFDGFGLWVNRALSSSDITTFYNGGAGMDIV